MSETETHQAVALNTAAPALSLSAVQALVAERYGMTDTVVQPLASERDQNCCIETPTGTRFVLKISNPAEAKAIIDFQIAALEHIAEVAPALPIPRVVRTSAGKKCDIVTLPAGSTTLVRMLSWLEGTQVRDTQPTPAQRRAMACCLGRLDLALQGFSHPAARHDLLWNVSAAHRLMDKLEAVIDPARRRLAEKFMMRFTTQVLPRLGSLRAQVIHNDYHLYNVLVAPDAQARLTGIIDFGDMIYAPLVGEVATAAAFQMTGCDDPFAGAAQFVGAYHKTLPLTDLEQALVTDLMATRHLITVLITEWRAARYPHNRAYIMRHNPAAWEALSMLADLTRDTARDRLLAEL